jgi:hypothetical protein
VSKPKFHFLVHLLAYIRCFGPAIVFSTERYESFNSVFRLASIHSNRHAPSFDICTTFAIYDAIKHIFTGGYWYDSSKKGGGPRDWGWVQAGKEVQALFKDYPEYVHLFGLTIDNQHKPGMLTLSTF